MQIEKNLSTSDIYDHYIKSDGLVIPYDNNFTYYLPQGNTEDTVYFRYDLLNGLIKYSMRNNRLHVTIMGHLNGLERNNGVPYEVDYVAASPMTRGYSYSGSGLPYPSPEIAYEKTPNRGTVKVDKDGDFQVNIEYPNAYYVRQGTMLVNPRIHFYAKSLGKLYTLDLGRPTQNRSLTGLPDRYVRSTYR